MAKVSAKILARHVPGFAKSCVMAVAKAVMVFATAVTAVATAVRTIATAVTAA